MERSLGERFKGCETHEKDYNACYTKVEPFPSYRRQDEHPGALDASLRILYSKLLHDARSLIQGRISINVHSRNTMKLEGLR